MRRSLAVILLGAALSASLPAQDSDSGLKPGQYLPGAFQVYPATGEHARRLHCLVCQNGLNPTLMVFTREIPTAEKPLGQLLKNVDQIISKYTAVKTGAFVVLLNEDAKDYVPRQALLDKLADAAKSLGTRHVGYALDGAAGPKGYNLDAGASEIVVFYHKHKVLAGSAYAGGGQTADDVAKISNEVHKTVAELESLVRPGRAPRK